jgi:hypothetical protein
MLLGVVKVFGSWDPIFGIRKFSKKVLQQIWQIHEKQLLTYLFNFSSETPGIFQEITRNNALIK